MRQEDIDRVARERPFRPFELQLVDGRKFPFDSPEGFVVGRSTLVTSDKDDDILLISLALVASVRQIGRLKLS